MSKKMLIKFPLRTINETNVQSSVERDTPTPQVNPKISIQHDSMLLILIHVDYYSLLTWTTLFQSQPAENVLHYLPHWRNRRLKFLPRKDCEQNVADFLNEITQCQKHKCYLCVLESTFSSVLGLRDLISPRSYAWAYIFVRTAQRLRPGSSHKVSLSFHCTSARMFLNSESFSLSCFLFSLAI